MKLMSCRTKRTGRRLAMAAGLLLQSLPAMALASPSVTLASETPPVAIDGGMIAGRHLSSGIDAYLGIPFARPPVGPLRWREPQPAEPWQGVRKADGFAPRCMQKEHTESPGVAELSPSMSEDCLYLNIWAPAAASAGKRPVIVYIYGGGFAQGSAARALVGGEALARKGVVYVSINYRVGVLGFLAHPQLTAESPHHVSGNYGLLDQLAALRWVQRNIARFGGDPANVTIMGHSAGSMSVSYLQGSPLAKGLFEKGVGLSGSSFFRGTMGVDMPLAKAEVHGVAFGETLHAATIADLRAVPAARIVDAAVPDPSNRFPVIDGYVLPADLGTIFAQGRQNDVPVLIGLTSDESFTPIGTARTVAQFRAEAQREFGNGAAAFLRLYPATTDAEARRASIDAGVDQSIGNMSAGWAGGQAAKGHAPAHVVMFARPPQYRPGAAPTGPAGDPAIVYHGADIPFWLDTLDGLTDQVWTASDRVLAEEMSDMLVRFARTGHAAPEAVWPAFDPRDPRLLRIGEDMRVQPWPGYRRGRFFDPYSPKAN